MSRNILCTYTVPSTGTQTEATLQAALAAVPLDLSMCRFWGAMPTSDVTSNVLGSAQRQINLQFDALATAPITAALEAGGGGRVASLTLGGQAGYWTAPPIIQFSGTKTQPGQSASAVPVMGVGQAVVANGGSGYNPATTTAKLVDGQLSATGVAATVGAVTIVAGKVTAVAITSQGSGYNVFPQIQIVDTAATPGSGAEVFGGLTIVSLTLVSPGGSYAAAPTVTAQPYFAISNNLSTEAPPTDPCFKGWMTGLIAQQLRTPVNETLPVYV
jgi:hypothetical protein